MARPKGNAPNIVKVALTDRAYEAFLIWMRTERYASEMRAGGDAIEFFLCGVVPDGVTLPSEEMLRNANPAVSGPKTKA